MILGPEPDTYQDLPALFCDDHAFRGEARKGALDRLLAAWYYLDRRYRVRSAIGKRARLDFKLDPWRSWLAIGQTLCSELKYESRKEYAAMGKEIASAIARVRLD
jgi:hypothetical protein